MAVEVFRTVTRAVRGGVRWYKRLDVEALRKTILRYRWTGSTLDVCAGILSTTVVAHPFPNANHRTSVYLARILLASRGITWPAYTLRGRGVRRFVRDTEPFFHQSKYLLQLMRHGPLVRVAHEEGFTTLTLGLGNEATILKEDLRLARDELQAKHSVSAKRLIMSLADEAALYDLNRSNDGTLRDLVQWYWH